MPARVRWSLLAFALVAAPRLAKAEEPESAPSILYDRGKSAYDDGDFTTAARSFARADELAPRADVLELAIASAGRADDPLLGMALVDRATARGLVSIASTGRELFASKVGRIEIACPGVERCSATVDGETAIIGAPFWSRVGEHAIELDADGEIERFTVHVAPSESTSVRPTRTREVTRSFVVAPSNPIPITFGSSVRNGEKKGGPLAHPALFFGAAGVTVAALGIAIVSGVDTLHTHAQFLRDRGRASLASDGESAQTRTNVLIVTTVALALVTATIGLFVTHWRPT